MMTPRSFPKIIPTGKLVLFMERGRLQNKILLINILKLYKDFVVRLELFLLNLLPVLANTSDIKAFVLNFIAGKTLPCTKKMLVSIQDITNTLE